MAIIANENKGYTQDEFKDYLKTTIDAIVPQVSELKTSAEQSATDSAKSAESAEQSYNKTVSIQNNFQVVLDTAKASEANASTSEEHAATSETNAKQALVESQRIQKEVESALNKVTGFAKYAGSVDNYSDLPTSGTNTGDVWNIVNADTAHQIKAGDNVIWNGKAWDNLSGFVDLSNYPTNSDVAKAIVDTTYSGGTITFIHKDGSKSTATIGGTSGSTSHAIQADQDGDGNVITDTYAKKTDLSNYVTSDDVNATLTQYAKKTDVPAVTVSGNTISFGSVTIGVD